jgi:Uncharacterised nucleotidyltransferase
MTSPSTVSATLALLRGRAPEDPVDWEEVVAFASAQLVLPALRPPPGAPAEAAEFLANIHSANVARNGEMRRALAELGLSLNRLGITPVLLKGAGILATDEPSDTGWRFLSDLDLQVPANRLDAALTAAQGLGFVPTDTGYNPARDAHYPALIAPGGRFALELHTRLFANPTLPLLDSSLPLRVQPIEIDRAVYGLPQLADRLAHLIAHAQLHHGHYRARRLLLRGCLEVSLLTERQRARELWQDVLAPFATGAQRGAAGAYLAAWTLLMTPNGVRPELQDAERVWASQAVERLSLNRRSRALRAVAAAAGAEILRAAVDPKVLGRHLVTIASPRELAMRLKRHRQKLQQAYWS